MHPAARSLLAELSRSDGPRLDRAALAISERFDPDVPVDAGLAMLDEAADSVGETTVEGIAALFGPQGLRGNGHDYYDPRNSLVPQVLHRRLGIPISLAVVAITVGDRLGVDLHGVGMPGHFLVGSGERFIDVFDNGRVTDLAGVAEIFRARTGGTRPFDESYIAPTPTLGIVMRMITNLQIIGQQARDPVLHYRAIELRLALPGRPDAERRSLAVAAARIGFFGPALELLVDSDDEDDQTELRRIRERLN